MLWQVWPLAKPHVNAPAISSTCQSSRHQRLTFDCLGDEPLLRQARRLRGRVKDAAREGFSPRRLGHALQDAHDLMGAWTMFRPSRSEMSEMIFGSRLPLGTQTFLQQLWQHATLSPAQASYCFYGHITAIFVATRLRPLEFASQEIGVKPSSSWIERVRRRGAEIQLPPELIAWMSNQLLSASLMFGLDRRLDQMHLTGWPVGVSEIVELMEIIREICVPGGPRGHEHCTVGGFERAAVSRLRRARVLGGVRVHASPASWWDREWLDRLRPVSIPALQNQVLPIASQKHMAEQSVQVILLGSHGALFRELEHSWRAAAPDLGLRSLSFLKIDSVYDPSSWLKQRKWERKPPMDFEQFKKKVFFSFVIHQYIDPSSYRPGTLRAIRDNVRYDDAVIIVCTIPSISCASASAMPTPVIMFAPTGVTVQVPAEHYGAWLRLLVIMAKDPKNHFVAMGPYTRAQIEYHTSLRVPVIPVLALYINATYTGRRSRNVLVHDRTDTLLAQALCAFMPDDFPLRIIGFLQTDRQYSTFAKHRAVIHVPGCVPEQMTFYEFYKMGIPIFIPADPAYYMWPRLPFTTKDTRKTDWVHTKCEYWAWIGTHQLSFGSENPGMLMNLTVRCLGRAIVHTVTKAGGAPFMELARIVPLKAMDDMGSTHALQLAGGQESLRSLGGRCIRLKQWPVEAVLRIWVGPSKGVCPPLDAPGACAFGPVVCPALVLWQPLVYVAPAPPNLAVVTQSREEPAQFERGGFGGTFWHLASFTLGRRRRGRRPNTSPFDLSTHYSLRQWSEAIDFFRYPGLAIFLSFASLTRQLVDLDVDAVSARMSAFGAERRSTALAAWRTTIQAAVEHESQSATFGQQ